MGLPGTSLTGMGEQLGSDPVPSSPTPCCRSSPPTLSGISAILTMTMKNSLMENLSADYVRTAVA